MEREQIKWKLYAILAIMTMSYNMSFGQVSQLADIDVGSGNGYPSNFIELNGDLYFIADDGGWGDYSLWKYDGTSVTEVYNPAGIDVSVNEIIAYDGDIYMRQENVGSSNTELFKFDIATQTGSLVAEINPSPSYGSAPQNFVVCGGYLYFTATATSNYISGWDLYQFDGVNLTAIDSANLTFSNNEISYETFGDTLFFAGHIGLYSYDGSNLVYRSGGASPSYSLPVGDLKRVEDRFYFTTNGMDKLYMYQGGVTSFVTDVKPSASGSGTLLYMKDGVLDNEYLFVVELANGDQELYKHDGTTLTLLDIDPTEGCDPKTFFNWGDSLYFYGCGPLGDSFWRYYHTGGGYSLEAVAVESYTNYNYLSNPLALDDEVIFQGETDAALGRELVSFTGDTVFTVYNINPINLGNSNPADFVRYKGKVVFRADDGTTGQELYEYCPIRRSTTSALACSAYSSPSGNYTWTSSGTYVDTVMSYLGCDSVITTKLHLLNEKKDYSTSEICYGNTVVVNGNTYNSNTTNSLEVLTGTLGCDSAVYVNVTVSPELNDAVTRNWSELEKIVASDRSEFGVFGSDIDISGNFAIVGAMGEDYDQFGSNPLDTAGAAYILEKDLSGNWVEVQKLIPSDRSSNDRFGYSVGISGNFAVVGAVFDDTDQSGNNYLSSAGSVYIFERDQTGTWNEIQKIVPSDRESGDLFGKKVAITDNYIAVGSWQKTVGSSLTAGVVYVFKRNYFTEKWEETQILVASDYLTGESFGFDVGIYQDRMVVGAVVESYDETGANYLNSSGAAYVFELDANDNWLEVDKIVASDRNQDDNFGHSVAIADDRLIVGAPFNDLPGGSALDNEGAAYIFERNPSGSWVEVEKLIASDASLDPSGFFGYDVDITACLSIVGAYANRFDENGLNYLGGTGAAYVYERRTNGNWDQDNKLVASDRDGLDNFGITVAISGGSVMVGSLDDHDLAGGNQLFNSGSVYAFESTIPCIPTSSSISITQCGSYTSDQGNTYGASGTFTEVINNQAGCDSTITINLTILPLPSATFSGLLSNYQVTDADDVLTGSPAGGTFTGVGISGSTFSPSSAGVGTFTITYSYTDGNGCTDSSSQTVTVYAACVSEATSSTDSKIDNVTLVGESITLNQSSSASVCETYTDYTSVTPADIAKGSSYVLEVTQGSCGADYERYLHVWIDFNGDGDFYDVGEDVTAGSLSSTVTNYQYSVPINVPTNAQVGVTNMRIVVKEQSGILDPCDIYTWGETEDYKVEILDPIGCPSYATSSDDSKIDNVTLVGESTTINQSSSATTCETYSDYTSVAPADILPGSSYTIEVTQGTCGGNWQRHLYLWIDFNRDGDFNDPNETITAGGYISSTANFTHTVPFSVPAGATLGLANMRVVIKELNGTIGPCDTYTWGETEDYLVQIGSCSTTSGTDIQTSCGPLTWIDGNTYSSSTNTPTYTLTNSNGCDSIVTLNLTVETVDTGISISGITLTANESGAIYQWIDCDNGNNPIAGETNQSFTPSADGSYAVEIEVSSTCSDVSSCIQVNGTGIDDNSVWDVDVYPNPAGNSFLVEFTDNSPTDIVITDITGKLVYRSKSASNLITIDSEGFENGTYLIYFSKDDQHTYIQRIVIQK